MRNVSGKIPVTAAILTYNSEQNLARCLDSVKECQEILILDGGSLDSTLSIARQFDATIKNQRPHQKQSNKITNFAKIRNRATKLARNTWIFAVAADEYVSPLLMRQIRKVTTQHSPKHLIWRAQSIFVLNGEKIDWASKYPVQHIRLFNKDSHITFAYPVHEEEVFDKSYSVGELSGVIFAPLPPISRQLKKWFFHYLPLERKKWRQAHMLTWRVVFLKYIRHVLMSGIKLPFWYLHTRITCQGKIIPFRYEVIQVFFSFCRSLVILGDTVLVRVFKRS